MDIQEGDITALEQNNIENYSQPAAVTPSKVTVSLPEHAASKLRDLVQRRDLALLRLGIISIQFEDDQIIPLTLNHATKTTQPKQQPISPPAETLNSTSINDSGQVELNENFNTPITDSSLPENHDVILVTSTVSPQASVIPIKNERNNNNLSVVYEDENEDDKDEDEVISEVENQHSSYNIHQLSQLDFADPIELDLYDTDNMLFPDFTLNLS